MSIFGGKKSKKGGSKAATPDSKASSKKSAQSPSDSATEPSALTEGTSKGRSVITCSILLMEAPAEAAKPGSSTPAGRKKFEVLQVSFTQDATINSVLQNVKLQSSHNKGSLASTCIGLCRPGGVEFVNSFSIKKYNVVQNELLLGIPEGLTAAQTSRHSENMRKSSKLKALLDSMKIEKEIGSPEGEEEDDDKSATMSATGVTPLSPSYVVYATAKKEENQKYTKASVWVPQEAPASPASPDISVRETTEDDRGSPQQMTPIKKKTVDLSPSKTFASKAAKGSLLPWLVMGILAFLAFYNNSVQVGDIEGGLSPGSNLRHVGLFSKATNPVPEPPAPEPLNVSVSKISDVPKAAGEVAKLAGQKIISAQNKIVPPEPAKPSVSTYAIPYASQLSLDKNGELVLTKNSKVVWSQKGKPGSSLTVGSDNKLMLGSAPLVVSDPAVASSWPFAGYLTKLSNFPRKREALLLLEVGVGLLFANFAGPKLAGLFAGGKANKATKATKGVAKAVKRARVR